MKIPDEVVAQLKIIARKRGTPFMGISAFDIAAKIVDKAAENATPLTDDEKGVVERVCKRYKVSLKDLEQGAA